MKNSCLKTNQLIRSGLAFALLISSFSIAACTPRDKPSHATLRTQGGMIGVVARWLDEYQAAWNAGDAVRLGRMLGLNTAEVLSLQQIFQERKNLRVTIEDVYIEPLSSSLARATYVRRDLWTDRSTGRPRSSSGAYEQAFQLSDGELRAISLQRR